MSKPHFRLVSKEFKEPIKESTNLLDIWNFILNQINEPRNWIIEEYKGTLYVTQRSAYSFVSEFKNRDSVPPSLN